MSEFRIHPAARPLKGTGRVPADKSISHRAAILSSLADGDTRIENWLPSQTTGATVNVLRSLGVDIEQPEIGTLIVRGRGLRSLQEPDGPLFCAGSGTTMRLLAGVCAGQRFFSILDGSPALKRRPMARIAEPLQKMGATVLGRDGGRLPPLAIQGAQLHGVSHELPVASAQVKSAILLAALLADSPTVVHEPFASRDHSERMLSAFGVKLYGTNGGICIEPPARLPTPTRLYIPNDLSSAAFLVVAALLVPGSSVLLQGVGVNPTRTGVLDALAQMGAAVRVENLREDCGEPVADLVVNGAGDLSGTQVSGELVPRMIDEFPIFAVAATQANGETCVSDASELRVKESDRIAALACELGKMGANIEERMDGFTIVGPTPLTGAHVSAHNDHRLAMSLAVAGLVARGETVIDGWECVADSFPNFGELLLGLMDVT